MLDTDKPDLAKILADLGQTPAAPRPPTSPEEVMQPAIGGEQPVLDGLTSNKPDLRAIMAGLGGAPQEPEERGNEFTTGVRRGVLSLEALLTGAQALAGGLFSEEYEAEKVKDYQQLQKEMEALSPTVGRVEDINSTGDFFTWLAGVTGEQVPMLVGFAATGGLGGLIGKKVGERLITKEVAHQAEKLTAKYASRGALAGATAMGTAVETGGIYGEQIDEGLERNKAIALGGGLLAGSLETFGMVKLARAFGFGDQAKGLLMGAIRSMPIGKRTLAMGALVGGTEAGTEFLQEAIASTARALVDEHYDILGEEGKSRLLNSAAAGFFVGGIPGAIGGAVTRKQNVSKRVGTETATVEELTEEEAARAEAEEKTAARDEAITAAIEPVELTGEEAKIEQIANLENEMTKSVIEGEELTDVSTKLPFLAETGANAVENLDSIQSTETTEQVNNFLGLREDGDFPPNVRIIGRPGAEPGPLQAGEIAVFGFDNVPVERSMIQEGEPAQMIGGFRYSPMELVNLIEAKAAGVTLPQAKAAQTEWRKAKALALQTVSRMTKEFMPNAKVIISDGSLGNTIKDLHDNDALTIKKAHGYYTQLKDGTIVIEVNLEKFITTRKKDKRGKFRLQHGGRQLTAQDIKEGFKIDRENLMGTLLHELGHALTTTAFRQAPKAIREAVYQEYLRWLKDIEKLTMKEFYEKYGSFPGVFRRADATGQVADMRLADYMKATYRQTKKLYLLITERLGMPKEIALQIAENQAKSDATYLPSFTEYLAEQFGRYARTARRPQGLVETFFAKSVLMFKRFFNKIVKRWYPNLQFAQWMEYLALKTEVGVPLAVEENLRVGGLAREDITSLRFQEDITERVVDTHVESLENFLKNKPHVPYAVEASLTQYADRLISSMDILAKNDPALAGFADVAVADGEVALVGFADNIEFGQALQQTVQNWVEMFSPDMKVIVTDTATWRGEVNSSYYGSMTRDETGVTYLAVNLEQIEFIVGKDNGQAFAYETLAHEFGHAIIGKEFEQAKPEIQRAIMGGYREWLNDLTGDMTVDQFFAKFGTSQYFANMSERLVKGARKDMKMKDWLGSQKDPSYWLSFDEYAANQLARYLISEKKVQAVAPSFWKGVIEKLKTLFESLKERMKGLPTSEERAAVTFKPRLTFKAWMDSLHLSAQHRQIGNLVAAADGLVAEEIDYETYLSEEIKKQETAVKKAMRGADSVVMEEVQKFKPAKFNWFMRLTLTLTQMVEQNLHIPGASKYLAAVRSWWTEKTRWTDRAQQTLDAWEQADFNKQDAMNFNKMVLEATRKSDELGRALTEEEKLDLFNKHKINTDAAKTLYETLQGDFHAAIDALFDVLDNDANVNFRDNKTALIAQLERLQKERIELKNRDFFPLTRFGRYWTLIRAKGPVKIDGKLYKAGETVRFEMYEREADMDAGFADMQRKYGKTLLVSAGIMSDTVASFQGMPRQLIESLREKLNLTEPQQEELNMLLHEMAPGQSYKKHLMHRKGVAGFSEDAKRGYANYFMHFSNHISRIKHYGAMTGAFKELDEYIARLRKTPGMKSVKEQELRDWMDRHYEYAMNPGNEWANIRSFGFLWYLGFLPKSALVNLTQVPLVTYPYLSARHGDVATVKALTKAMTDIRRLWQRGVGLEPELQTAVEMGIQAGFLDESLATELAAVAEGSNLQTLIPGTFMRSERGARMIRKASGWGAWLFQKAERVNRLQTFAAAFRLAQAQLLKGQKLSQLTEAAKAKLQQDSFEAARDAVEKTQYEYARFNRPEFMRGKKSVIFLFWQYMQNTLYFAATDKGRLRFMFMMMMLAGLSGIPFAEDFMDMLDFTMSKMKQALGWKNPKVDSRLALREFIGDLGMNPDVVMHGVARRTFGLGHVGEMVGIPIPNVDLSGSLSLGRIVPGVEAVFGREGKLSDRFTAAATDVGGAAFSIPMSVLAALSDDNPNVFKRWERAMPSALRSVTRAYRFASEGEETSRTGARLAEFNVNDPEHMAEIIAQGLGAAPTRLNEMRELRWMQKEHANYYAIRRQMIMEQFAYALQTGDRETIARMRKRLTAYNAGVPVPALKISGRDLKRSIQSRRKGQYKEEAGLPRARRDIPLYQDIAASFE